MCIIIIRLSIDPSASSCYTPSANPHQTLLLKGNMTTEDDDLSNPYLSGEDGDEEEDEETKALKRRERLEQNRISARESRKRKKNMIEELQRTVITLSRENKDLNERNEGLRRELVEIGTKNPGVVSKKSFWFYVMCAFNQS